MECHDNHPLELKIPVDEDKEESFDIPSNDFFRPSLRQIRNSVFEIKKYFMDNNGNSREKIIVIPNKAEDPFSKLKILLLQHLMDREKCLLLRRDVLREVTPELREEYCQFRGVVVVAESLAVVLNLNTEPRPSSVVCDAFIAMSHQPSILVSFVDCPNETRELRIYNASIARGLTVSLGRFMDEGYKTLFGVLSTTKVENIETFNDSLGRIIRDSSMIVTTESLSMKPSKFEKLITAFWAGVAETKSVMFPPVDYLRFLTKEQCIILVENINSKMVQVKSRPKSGATTLMLEVAQRVSRNNKTLLVCNTQTEKDTFQAIFAQTRCSATIMTIEEARGVSLLDYRYIVGVADALPHHDQAHYWSFTSDEKEEDDVHELTCLENQEEVDVTSKDQYIADLENKLQCANELLREKETELTHLRAMLKPQKFEKCHMQWMNPTSNKKEEDNICRITISDLSFSPTNPNTMCCIVGGDDKLMSLINQRDCYFIISWRIQL